jgi:Xaa-Pro aminopeptidase
MLAAMVADDAAWQFSPDEESPPVTLGELLRSLRRSKHPDEVALLERCSRACEAGHLAAFDCIQPGISELEVFLAVQRAAQEQAGEPCVVYGDFRATNPMLPKAGGLPTSYRLQSGDLFILDYSVILQGYRCDFTNTIAVGTPSPAAAAQFAACTNAIAAAESLLQPGAAGRAIWKAASTALEQAECGPLAHHAGHGLGLEHPELPILVSDSDDALQAGDVVTLEPGCYIPGTGGIRLEHNYLITQTGFRRLSQHRLSLQR